MFNLRSKFNNQVGTRLIPRWIKLQSHPSDKGSSSLDGDQNLRRVYDANGPLILHNHQPEFSRCSTFQSIINLQTAHWRCYIYLNRHDHQFRLNLEFGPLYFISRKGPIGILNVFLIKKCLKDPFMFPDDVSWINEIEFGRVCDKCQISIASFELFFVCGGCCVTQDFGELR